MAESLADVTSRRTDWNQVAGALLLGFGALNAFLTIPVLEGVGGPDGASQILMWVAVLSVVSNALVRERALLGYWCAVLTGLAALTAIAIIGTGALGPLPGDATTLRLVLRPAGYVMFALLLVGVTYLAWRDRAGLGSSLASGSD